MDNKQRIRARAEAKLAKMKPNGAHARRLRAKLDISETSTQEDKKKPRKKSAKKTTEQ